MFSAVTGADGRYTLPMPYATTYTLRAGRDSYASEIVSAPTPGRACAHQDFGLTIDNTISGNVVDENGRVMHKGRVGLIDLDHPNSGDSWDSHIWFNDAYVEGSGFTFRNVPLGRYLLVFNPDGPVWEQVFDQEFDSTYYPSTERRSEAGVIEIKSAGVHLTDMNVVMGKHVDSREVTISTRFSDGTAMTSAEIRCVGLPLHEGDPEWTGRSLLSDLDHPGTVQLIAPANRRLRIELRDVYGRDLKKPYVAEFEPGATPINLEFVVEP